MGRRTGVIAAVAAAGLAGCLDEQVARFKSKPVDVPATSEASVATAARVDQVGRQLVSQNPFLGIEPMFHTLGRREPELLHPDPVGVFVTEGMVERCKTDDEVAAVLATELARMSIERRTADRMRLPEPPRPLPDAGGTTLGADPNQLAVQAIFDGKLSRPRKDGKPAPDDPRQLAEEILRSAGYDPKALDTVAPLLQEARRNHAAADYFSQPASKPRWSP